VTCRDQPQCRDHIRDQISDVSEGGVVDQGWWIFWTVVAAVIGCGWYVIACAWFPFADCAKCEGRGKFRSKSGRTFRRCRRCKGTGERVRLGRRVWKKLGDVKKSAVG
jgi:hypothetical protein